MVRAGWTLHSTRRVRTQGKTKGLPTRPKGRWNARCPLRWKTPTDSARRDGWIAKVGPELLRRRAFYEGCGHPRHGRHSRCAPGTYVYLAECMYAPRNLHKRRPNPLRLKCQIDVVGSVRGGARRPTFHDVWGGLGTPSGSFLGAIFSKFGRVVSGYSAR